MNSITTKSLKVALGLSLMSLFVNSTLALGVSNNSSDLTQTTLGSDSAYALYLKDNSSYQDNYITKYLTSIDEDGNTVYTPKYYSVSTYPMTTNYGSGGIINYYWQSNGTISETSSNVVALSISYSEESNETYNDGYYYGGSSSTSGGAIANDSSTTIESISADFVENSATSQGGAIHNAEGSTITSISGAFIDNSANFGGAIHNFGTIGTISGSFTGNISVDGGGGAIYNHASSITSITGNFVGNSAKTGGGAILNWIGNDASTTGSSIDTVNADFIGNSAGTYGGAIFNWTSSTIGSITGDFIKNYANISGGAICNTYQIDTITGDFIGNSATTGGGAIFNLASDAVISSISGDFIGNSAGTYGGAIYNLSGEMSFVVTDSDINFTGNYVGTDDDYTSNAIYNGLDKSTDTSTINFNTTKDYSIVINDGIDGDSATISRQILNVNDDDLAYTGTVEFNNTVANNTVNVNAGTLKLGTFTGADVNDSYEALPSKASLSNVDLTVDNGATLNIATAGSLSVTDDSSITLSSGSTLIFEKSTSLVVDATSSISFTDGADVTIDIGGLTLGEDLYYTLIDYSDDYDSDSTSVVCSYLQENLVVTYDGYEVESSNDTWVVLTAENGDIVLTGVVVPESSTYAMIFGSLALGLAIYRRRK